MELLCPKCAFPVVVDSNETAFLASLNSILCAQCGASFDARAVVNMPGAIEAIDPEAAAAELKKLGPEPKKPRHLPKKIGAYDVIAEINRGGMGIVYKASDPQLRRLVAIKVLLAGEGARDEDIKRFQREAQATARLLHPNIVPIYAVGEHEGKPYLVMDFVEGRTAKQLKEDGIMTPRLALSIIESAAEALHHAHSHGVIHRDVKPANILVDQNERIQLMDFGLARRVDEDLEVTQSGTTMGTPSYMSPEQAEGNLDAIDAQSDIYSAGACLYDLLTGHPPFEAPTVLATLKKVVEYAPLPPRARNPKIHRDVETICLKCLEKEKKNRYSSARQLADDIRRFNAGEAITARPPGFIAARLRFARRHKEITLAALIVVFAAFGALGYTLNEARRVTNQQLADQASNLEKALRTGNDILDKARETVAMLKNSQPANFQEHALIARSLIADSNNAFRQAESIAPENAEARRGLDTVKKLDNEVEVQRFIFKARAFLSPAQGRPGDPPVPPNFAGAEFAAQEAVDRDSENMEARELLRVAAGIRAVSIDAAGQAAEVSVKRIADASGRNLAGESGDGKSIGVTPVRGKPMAPGLYILTFKRQGMPHQQTTISVTREAADDELAFRFVLNSPGENTVLIAEGNASLPQIGDVKIGAYFIDRYEYPNKAGAIPLTGVTLVEARDLCKERGKSLCTSAQWLRACMGDEERRYPYGKTYAGGLCAMGLDGASQNRPVASGIFSRCRTPEGVYDMSGNAAEWTDSDQQEVVFGGEWTSPGRFADLTVSCRARALPEEVNKERLGFRCCKNK